MLESQLLIEQLRAESELKTKWLSLIAHDFKGLFSNISLLLKMFEDKAISHEQFLSMIPELKEIADRNSKTLENTFAWVKSQTEGFNLQIEDVSIYDLFRHLTQEFDKEITTKNILLKFQGDRNLMFKTDKFLLTFILKQTIENAIKYSNRDGEVVVSTKSDSENIEISIKDNGVGMKKNSIDNLGTFENAPYSGTMQEKGVGLSMVIVKDFVEKLGGTMEVGSKPNEGTTVQLMFGTKL